MNNKRWLRYGLVGNFLTYGIGVGFMIYLGIAADTKDGSFGTSGKIRPPRWTRNLRNSCSLSVTRT
jgi:hypothetical protein